MTTRITADNIVAGTITSDRIAANAVTLDKIAVGTFGPRITGVVLPNSGVAVLPNGSENFTINGSNFQPGVQVYIGTTAAAAVVYVSSTQLVVTVPVMSPGTYALYVTNTDGGTAIRLLAVTVSTAPVWATDSVLPTQFATLSLQLSAVSDSSVIYTLASGSSLPTGLSLSTAGVLSGTISNITSSTTYNFTVVATDLESQTNSRAFSVSVTVGDLNFPAVPLLLQTGASLSRSTTVTDVATPLGTFTASGSPTFGLTSPYQPDGYWSNYFNGSSYLTSASNVALALGSGNFTLESWVFVTNQSVGSYPTFLANWAGSFTTNAWSIHTGHLAAVNRAAFYCYNYSGSAPLLQGATTLSANTWYHIAVVRNGNNFTLYLNGVSDGTGTFSGSVDGGAINIIYAPSLTNVWAGYLSNTRIVKGVAVYTGTFTPPTSPLQTTQSFGTNISAITGTATSLLTCQSNRFIDNSTNNFTITANGAPLVSAETPLQADGYWSNQFNGSTDYAGPANNAAFQFGANNFTIEYWFNQISRLPSGYDGPFVLTGSMYFTMGNGPSGYAFVAPNQAYIILSNLPSLNTWHHMAIVRNGSTFTAYLNGVSMGTTTFAGALANPTGGFQVGWAGTFDSYFNGYISNFRAVNGTAVYTSNFTPPTAPLTATQSAGTNIAAVTGTATALLTCQSNSFKDNSTNNFAIIRNGSPAIKSVIQPFVSSITSNGAALFNGSSSYLSSASSASFALGTNNFTIEMWVYLTTASGNKVAASFGNFATFDPLIGYLSGGTSFEIRLSSTASSWDLSNGSVLAYTLNLNSWTHIALVRNGSNIALYGNGSSVGSVTSSASIYQSGNNIFLGKGQAAFYFPGYIANYRFVRGTAVYTGNFTPPSNFLTTTGGTYPSTANVNTSIASTDTALLANLNDSTYLGASTLNTVTRNGNPSTGWVSPYQTDGYWGNFFNGSTDYFTLPTSAALTLTANFTIEFWVYSGAFASGASNPSFFNTSSASIFYESSGSNRGLCLFVGSAIITTATTVLPNNQWNHVACVRSGSTVSMFVNGSRIGANAAFSSTADFSGAFINRYFGSAAGYLNGYMSNLRVVKGAAVYDPTLTTLTVPIAPLGKTTGGTTPPTGTQTSLLTCQSNRFIDNSDNPLAITVNGTPQVTPYYYPSGFTAPAASPGAAYFNGSTDYLSIADSPAFTLSNVNWTIECWIYCPNNANNRSIAGHCNSTATAASSTFILYLNDVNRLYIEVYSGSTTYSASTSANVPYNQWSHIVATRDGSTVRLYINGVQYGTVSVTGVTLNDPASNFSVARIGEYPNWTFLGYISNFRLVKGTCVYSNGTTFTPPTAPVTAITNTTLLLNLGDSNYTSAINAVQNNTFIDTGPYAFPITRNGTPTQGSITPYWPNGQWSNYFNGSSYIRSPGFNFSTSDFTIECFLNTAFLGSGPQFLGGYDSTGNNYTITMQAAGLITYYLSSDGSNWNIAAGVSLGTAVANRWHHIVIARTGTTIRGYFDGVGGTVITTSAAIFNNATNFWLGAAGSAGGNLTGYLSNVRILNGSSVYNATQSTITVPTAPFATGTTNQVLLTCYSNRFIDANTATTAKTITVTGTPTVQAFQPFSLTASYTAAAYGGSGYFNGSTDYLTAAYNSSFVFGTNNFTVECWIYLTSNPGMRCILSLGYGANGSGPVTSTWQLRYYGTEGSNQIGFCRYDGSVETNFITSGAPGVVNSWTHIAVSRTGGTLKIFVNGISYYSAVNTFNYTALSTSEPFQIGLGYYGPQTGLGGPRYFPGYISNARIINGTGIYSSNFDPPTTPVTNITNTSLLLNMANAGIYDAAAQNNMTTVGDAQASTTQYKWSPTSMKFDGTGDYLNIPDSPALQLGAGNFTIEFWWRPIALSGYQTIFDKGFGSAGGLLLQTGNNNGILDVYVSGVVVITASSGTSVGSWDYYALVRSGSALTLYRNGSSVGSTTSSVNFNVAAPWFIGAQNSPSPGLFSVNGYIQDFRITKGVARTITTPTAAFLTR